MAEFACQLGMCFKQGDVDSPVIDGIATQRHIMTTWPDGSANHVIFFFILTGNVNDVLTLTIVEGTPASGSPALVSMDASIEAFGTVVAASQLSFFDRYSGPIAVQRVYYDNTNAHDILTDAGTNLRPRIEITHWGSLSVPNAKVRFIMENCRASATGEIRLPIILRINSTIKFDITAQEWYQMMTGPASRVNKTFWLNTPPNEPQVLKQNLPYLISTGAIPNWDMTVTIPESVIASDYAAWNAIPGVTREILYNSTNGTDRTTTKGGWNKAMPNTGGRPDIGPTTKWISSFFYTGDRRHKEIAVAQGDLAAEWGVHYRENDGSYFSIANHPGVGFVNPNPGDGVTIVPGRYDGWGWVPDVAHQPAHYYGLYLLTGENFYYEQMMFWAHWSAAYPNGAGTNFPYGRGPTGFEGGCPSAGHGGQVRQHAWLFRSRVEAAYIAPVGTEKTNLTRWVNDFIAIEEGARNILGTPNQGNANWNWGFTKKLDPHPLKFWQTGVIEFCQRNCEIASGATCDTAMPQWESHALTYALARAQQLGFASQALLAWMAECIGQQVTTLDKFIGAYRIGTGQGGVKFTTMVRVLQANVPGFDMNAEWYNNLGLDQGWSLYGCLGAASVGNRPAWLEALYDEVNFSTDPKLAILPFSGVPPIPPPGDTGSIIIDPGTDMGGGIIIGGG